MTKGLVLLPAILMMSFVVLGIGLTGLLIVFTLGRLLILELILS